MIYELFGGVWLMISVACQKNGNWLQEWLGFMAFSDHNKICWLPKNVNSICMFQAKYYNY